MWRCARSCQDGNMGRYVRLELEPCPEVGHALRDLIWWQKGTSIKLSTEHTKLVVIIIQAGKAYGLDLPPDGLGQVVKTILYGNMFTKDMMHSKFNTTLKLSTHHGTVHVIERRDVSTSSPLKWSCEVVYKMTNFQIL